MAPQTFLPTTLNLPSDYDTEVQEIQYHGELTKVKGCGVVLHLNGHTLWFCPLARCTHSHKTMTGLRRHFQAENPRTYPKFSENDTHGSSLESAFGGKHGLFKTELEWVSAFSSSAPSSGTGPEQDVSGVDGSNPDDQLDTMGVEHLGTEGAGAAESRIWRGDHHATAYHEPPTPAAPRSPPAPPSSGSFSDSSACQSLSQGAMELAADERPEALSTVSWLTPEGSIAQGAVTQQRGRLMGVYGKTQEHEAEFFLCPYPYRCSLIGTGRFEERATAPGHAVESEADGVLRSWDGWLGHRAWHEQHVPTKPGDGIRTRSGGVRNESSLGRADPGHVG